MIKIYGIKNCDTVKKSLKWLDDRGLKYQFHDYKKAGVDEKKLADFVEEFGFEKIVNRKGTTWRMLDALEQNKVVDKISAIKLMLEKPSIIKRPLVEFGCVRLVGFDENEWQRLVG